MVVPATPGPDLVICQATFALAALQTFLDAMLRFGDAGQFAARRIGRGIAEVIVMLHRTGFIA